jgi:hypothetical protein
MQPALNAVLNEQLQLAVTENCQLSPEDYIKGRLRYYFTQHQNGDLPPIGGKIFHKAGGLVARSGRSEKHVHSIDILL